MPRAAVPLIAVALVGVLALVLALSRAQSVDIVDGQRTACERGLLNSADAVASEIDTAAFQRDASAARRADGNDDTADRYAASAARAEERARRRESRLLGASLPVLQSVDRVGRPTAAARAAADAACARANPSPGILP